MVWINPAAAWESAVDAAAGLACDEVVLLLVTEDIAEQDTFTGLLGPAGHEPGEAFAGRTRLRAYMKWLSAYHGVDVTSYDELWRWSIGDLEGFWSSVAEFFEVRFHEAPQTVLEHREMPGACWFPGATLSYPEHIFRGREDEAVAIRHASELRPLAQMTWDELRALTISY